MSDPSPAATLRIGQVMIFVDDLAAARRFYEGLLGIPVESDLSEPLDLIILRHEGCILTLHSGFPARPMAEERRIAIAFAVPDIEAEVRRLRAAGAPLVGDIEDTPVHRFQMLTDPAGNLVEIGQYRTPPADPAPTRVATVRRALEALDRGDLGALASCYAEETELVLNDPARTILRGRTAVIDRYRAFLAGMARYRVEVEEVQPLPAGGVMAVTLHRFATVAGVAGEVRQISRFTVGPAGILRQLDVVDTAAFPTSPR
jgi:predicted enzyme related to lactoylglutathione lyase